ncbi:hypothetical protein K239x_48860 [Planctomycetes bacterium K23_9]|uniref:Phage integrase family protein n=1 Tax=Stieleria marina TaxID=1930275 RepID=A0A517P0G9_9BACT|nr:hypothetical protein K239x_48860 [Planctomycetes bacterium K23_9]
MSLTNCLNRHATATCLFSATQGEERARIYTLSYMTGLRKGEVASLTKGSFKLTGKSPILTVGGKS